MSKKVVEIERTEFTCPTCGSHYYGSSKDGKVYSGHCHGDGCAFSWLRKEDSKYFHFVLDSGEKQEIPADEIRSWGLGF